MTQFIPFSRDQAFLLPPDAKDWFPADDVAHFVVAAVERVPLGAFAVRPIPGGKRAVSSAADAGAADLQLRQRHLLLAPHRAGNASRPRRALRGGEPAPRPRHHRRVPPRQPRRLRGSLPAGAAAGARERLAAARHGGDRRHQARRQRLQDPLRALRPGQGDCAPSSPPTSPT